MKRNANIAIRQVMALVVLTARRKNTVMEVVQINVSGVGPLQLGVAALTARQANMRNKR